MNTLGSRRVDDGVVFELIGNGTAVEVSKWTGVNSVRGGEGRPVRVGPLLRLIDDGEAEQTSPAQITVRDEALASLTPGELAALGLPPPLIHYIDLHASGSITDIETKLVAQLRVPAGRQIASYEREGAFLTLGDERYTLSAELLRLFASINRFNTANTRDERFRIWGEISTLLPERVVVADQLRAIRVVVASAFTIRPFINDRGEPDFDPVPGRSSVTIGDDLQERETFHPVLPEVPERDFRSSFRSLQPRDRYSAGDGWFLFTTETVKRALKTLKKIQSSDPATRRRFIQNPSGFIREDLDPDGLDPDVEKLFSESGYSDRVKGVGLWQPVVLPWLKRSTNEWLPPDSVGLKVEGIDEPLAVKPTDVDALIGDVRAAQEQGQASVTYGGVSLPASSQTLDALERLKQHVTSVGGTDQNPTNAAENDATERSTQKVSLLIIDNFEVLGYSRVARCATTAAGGNPTVLRSTLLPHQKEALRWLQEHWVAGSPGALVADDMGLGKTIQSLAFLAWMQEEVDLAGKPRKPILIVAPTGLLENWKAEHEKHLFAPGLGQITEAYSSGLRALRGGFGRGNDAQVGIPQLDYEALSRADWVLTTYETVRDYELSLAKVNWSVVVMDEAQKIKNPAAGVSKAAKLMKQDFVITLTGTPVENRLADLWNIVDATQPGRLGSLKAFSARYEAEGCDATELRSLQDSLLRGESPSLMIRRFKHDYLDGLPTKHLHPLPVTMPAVQAEAYRNAIRSAVGGTTTNQVLQILQNIRAISLHPTLSDLPSDDAGFITASARLSATFDLLDQISARQEKVLVFVEFRAIQGILAEAIQRRFRLRERPLIVNGEIAGKERLARVNRFQERHGFDVLIVSPRAGGVGLNVTAANNVIHLSRWWNPAVEDQCTDRVYRIGQTRPVNVYIPIAKHPEIGDHSFDVKLDQLLERKRGLNRQALSPPAATAADLNDLYQETVGGGV